MEEKTFEEIEAKVVNSSVAYINSKAFRTALGYIERNNEELYKELINMEYNEAFE